MQAYSDPKRESDPHALPDVDVFEFNPARDCQVGPAFDCHTCGERHTLASALRFDKVCPDCARGWYWQACFPGCLPDSEPIGPFATQAEALADAQSNGEE